MPFVIGLVFVSCNNSPFNIDDPLNDLPWLKEIVDGFESDAEILGYNPRARIYQCAYKKGTGFLLEMCVECPDAGYSFRDIKGIVLCGGGGLSGKDNCSGFKIDFENKKLIWEMEEKIEPQEPCYCIMDTLRGEWNWISKSGGVMGGSWNNEFKSIIKILSQNEDETINYEVFVADTLFSKGNFQILYNQYSKSINIQLPHRLLTFSGYWRIYLVNSREVVYNEESGHHEYKPSKDDFMLSDGAIDGYCYSYKKIK